MSKDEKKTVKGNPLTIQEQLEGKLFKERRDNERKQNTIDNLNAYIGDLQEDLAIVTSELAEKKSV